MPLRVAVSDAAIDDIRYKMQFLFYITNILYHGNFIDTDLNVICFNCLEPKTFEMCLEGGPFERTGK